MQRKAWLMKVHPGQEREYQRRHDAVWPELAAALRAAGVSDYSIFLDERTGDLFAVQKLADGHTADDLPNQPIVKKWWASMADIMETHADDSPVCIPLREVFHQD